MTSRDEFDFSEGITFLNVQQCNVCGNKEEHYLTYQERMPPLSCGCKQKPKDSSWLGEAETDWFNKQ